MVQYRVVAYNASGSTASNTVTVINAPPPVIATTTLPGGQVAVAYSQALTVTDGLAPFTWTVSAGALPTSLTLNAATGVISGTPSVAGTFNFTVTVTDLGGRSATQALSITVAPPAVVDRSADATCRQRLPPRPGSTCPGQTAPTTRTASRSGVPSTALQPTQIGTVTRTNAQSTATGGNVTFPNTGLTAGNTYAYFVTAVSTNPVGTSVPSNTVTVLFTLPAAPSGVTAAGTVVNNNNARATLNWTDNASNETGFTIQRARNATFTNQLTTSNVAANVTTFTTGNLSRGTRYWFRVRANNQLGSSAWVNATPFPLITP